MIAHTPETLNNLRLLAGRIAGDVEWYGGRLIVEAWDPSDSGPVAWIDMHPDDSAPQITFDGLPTPDKED